MDFFKKVQNIVRFTIVIFVQISQKYLIFEHHYSVILMYLFRKLQSRYTMVILVQTSQKYLIFGHHYIINLRNFFQKIQNVRGYSIVILVQISRKYLFLTPL